VRVVLDSNVLIAAFATRGLCFEVLEHCSREHQPVTSPVILMEVRDNLVAKIGVAAPLAEEAVALLRSRFRVVEPAELPRGVSRDRDDDAVLGTAVAGGCDLIVTGDRDLLDLERYEKISIVSPREFWKREFLSRNGE
jgi:putative PIN family toxin of toxin-antitoxin system